MTDTKQANEVTYQSPPFKAGIVRPTGTIVDRHIELILGRLEPRIRAWIEDADKYFHPALVTTEVEIQFFQSEPVEIIRGLTPEVLEEVEASNPFVRHIKGKLPPKEEIEHDRED